MRLIFERYRQEVSTDPVEMKEVGEWASAKGLWEQRPADINASFDRDMADSLREEIRVDKAGRRYRAKIAARVPSKSGLPLFKWADIDDAPRDHVEKGVAQKRKQIVADAYHLRIDVDHYNSDHPDQPPLPLILDFTDDVEELLIAHGIDDDEAA